NSFFTAVANFRPRQKLKRFGFGNNSASKCISADDTTFTKKTASIASQKLLNFPVDHVARKA
ncbi:hypothetical protein V6N11_057163, partial [Hibiscus sabdariffa]